MNAISRFFGFGDLVETRGGSVDSEGGDSPLIGVMPPAREAFGVVSWREAMKVSAFSRSVDEINTMMTSMPATVRHINGPLLERDRGFPSIVDKPNLDMDYEEFIQSSVNDLILHGEFFWLRVGDPQTVNLVPVSPIEMTAVRDRLPDGTWGRTRYAHMGKEIHRSRIVHKKHTAINGEPRGFGPLHHAQTDLRAAILLADFQADWFGSDVPPATLKTEQHLNASQQEELQQRWNKFIQSHKGQTVILSSGLTLEPMHLKPVEAQMLEVSDAIDRKIVRVLGTPAFDLLVPGGSESRTYQNLEQSTLQFLVATLAKYMNAIERGLTDVIPRGLKVELDEAGLLRMDSKTKSEVDTANIQNGTRTVNELRARDGHQPLPEPSPVQTPSVRVDETKEVKA